MDKLLIKRGSKRALEQLDPLQVGELFLAKDEERLYVGGPRGNISLPTQKDLDEKATKTELQQVSLAYKESYDTLDDLKNAYPNGDVYNHVVLADGMIYTYANGEWVSTGVEANGTIEFMKAYEDLKVLGVGGRNLLRNSDFSNGSAYWEGQFSLTEEGALLQSTVGDHNIIQSTIEIPEGDYVVQIRYKVIEGQAPYLFATNGTDMTILEGSVYFDVADNDWNIHTVRVRVRSKSRFFAIRYAISVPVDHVEGKTIISWVKLEKGNKATDWTPAPEDIDAHPFVVELAETVFRSKQNEERIRDLEEKLISN